jgi:hypothetical protein
MCQRLNKRNFIKTMLSHPHRPKDNISFAFYERAMTYFLIDLQ